MFDLTDEQIDEAAFNEAFIAVFGVGHPDGGRPPVRKPCPDCDDTGDCRDCDGTGESEDNHEDNGECSACLGLGTCVTCDDIAANDPASALTRAWEAASGEGQVVS